MRNRETIRLSHGEFFISGPDVEFDVETWTCSCRTWPIVVASSTQDMTGEGWPKREAWFVRPCGICKTQPRPIDPDREVKNV